MHSRYLHLPQPQMPAATISSQQREGVPRCWYFVRVNESSGQPARASSVSRSLRNTAVSEVDVLSTWEKINNLRNGAWPFTSPRSK